MDNRLGFGPVFGCEWLTTSRRWQVYGARALFVFALLVGLASVWVSRVSNSNIPPIEMMAEIGRGFFSAIVFTQMTLVLMVAPAATAGSICQDRSSGKLAQLLATDLSDTEIVLGKLVARLIPVLGLVGCALPVLALSALMGGVDPLALAGAFLITVSLAVFGCTLALAFSVWASKPYEVLLATYAIFGAWLLAIPVWDFLGSWWRFPTSPDWAIPLNPFYLAFAPYVQPGRVGVAGYLEFIAGMLILSASLASLAIGKMRVVLVDQANHSALRKPLRIWRFGSDDESSLDTDPFLWLETRRTQPSAWLRTLIGAYHALAVVFTLLAVYDSLWKLSTAYLPAYVVAFQVAIGLPLVLISAATAVVEERARGSLDVLLATPLATRRIVLAKWWGAFRHLRLLLLLPLLVAIAAVWPSGPWLLLVCLFLFEVSAAAMWTSIGLALSTWIPRLGRAVSLAVAMYVLAGLAWPILAMTLFQREGSGLSAISPFYGCFDLTLMLSQWSYHRDLVLWVLFWISAQTVVSGGLLLATLATFDRCLGRIDR